MSQLPSSPAAASALSSSPAASFDVWAPELSPWSAWTKPILFAHLDDARVMGAPPALPELDAAPVLAPFTSDAVAAPRVAFVVDLPGVDAFAVARALAQRGVRPVLLHNGTHGPNPLVDIAPLVLALRAFGESFASLSLPADAPPAFILDARRMAHGQVPAPRHFDNRWLVLPQDFPSGHVLKQHGIERAVVVTGSRVIASDLAHVIVRWQELGIAIHVADETLREPARPTDVAKPSGFRSLLHAWATVFGLRRNAAGGFGSVIPEPNQSSG